MHVSAPNFDICATLSVEIKHATAHRGAWEAHADSGHLSWKVPQKPCASLDPWPRLPLLVRLIIQMAKKKEGQLGKC